MIYQLAEIKLKHPYLYDFLTQETDTTILFTLDTNILEYELTVENKGLIKIPTQEIIAAFATPYHFDFFISKSTHPVIAIEKAYKAAVRAENILMIEHLLQHTELKNQKTQLKEHAQKTAERYSLHSVLNWLVSPQNKRKLESDSSIDEITKIFSNTNFFSSLQFDRKNKLLDIIKKKGFPLSGTINEVPEDGNCFFHCVSQAINRLNPNEKKWDSTELRLASCAYMEENEDKFIMLFENKKALFDYTNKMRNYGSFHTPGEWAEGPILHATALCTDTNITINAIGTNDTLFTAIYPDEENNASQKVNVHLILHVGHYFIYYSTPRPSYIESESKINSIDLVSILSDKSRQQIQRLKELTARLKLLHTLEEHLTNALDHYTNWDIVCANIKNTHGIIANAIDLSRSDDYLEEAMIKITSKDVNDNNAGFMLILQLVLLSNLKMLEYTKFSLFLIKKSSETLMSSLSILAKNTSQEVKNKEFIQILNEAKKYTVKVADYTPLRESFFNKSREMWNIYQAFNPSSSMK